MEDWEALDDDEEVIPVPTITNQPKPLFDDDWENEDADISDKPLKSNWDDEDEEEEEEEKKEVGEKQSQQPQQPQQTQNKKPTTTKKAGVLKIDAIQPVIPLVSEIEERISKMTEQEKFEYFLVEADPEPTPEDPQTKVFTEIAKSLGKRVEPNYESPHYRALIKEIYRLLCENLNVDELNELLKSLGIIVNEKIQNQKGKPKKSKKKKATTLKRDDGNIEDDDYGAEYDDY